MSGGIAYVWDPEGEFSKLCVLKPLNWKPICR